MLTDVYSFVFLYRYVTALMWNTEDMDRTTSTRFWLHDGSGVDSLEEIIETTEI